MNKFLKNTFASEWIQYAVVIVLSVAIWIAAFGLWHAPKKNETIELFFAGKVKDYAFEQVAIGHPNGIKMVRITSSDPSDQTFYQKYSVVGLNGSDVLILPVSIAEKTDCRGAFASIEGIGESYRQEEVAYGVFLPEKAVDALRLYFDFKEERYIAFVSAASVKTGGAVHPSTEFLKWLVAYV